MSSLEHTVRELAPQLYIARAEIMGRPPHTDLSHSNQCQNLTFDFMEALQNRGIQTRRELHKDDNGDWHYILAHADPEAEASNQDVITDLNPWQYTVDSHYSGILHATRNEVMNTLRESEAPESFVALRSISTIVTVQNDRR